MNFELLDISLSNLKFPDKRRKKFPCAAFFIGYLRRADNGLQRCAEQLRSFSGRTCATALGWHPPCVQGPPGSQQTAIAPGPCVHRVLERPSDDCLDGQSPERPRAL